MSMQTLYKRYPYNVLVLRGISAVAFVAATIYFCWPVLLHGPGMNGPLDALIHNWHLVAFFAVGVAFIVYPIASVGVSSIEVDLEAGVIAACYRSFWGKGRAKRTEIVTSEIESIHCIRTQQQTTSTDGTPGASYYAYSVRAQLRDGTEKILFEDSCARTQSAREFGARLAESLGVEWIEEKR